MSKLELNQTGLSLPVKVVKVGEPPYDGDGWDKSKPYYLVDGADGTVLCGVTESFKNAFEYMAQCTNSHTPVIDAVALAKKITDDYWKMAGNCCDDDLPHPDEERIAAVITSNRHLQASLKVD